MVSVVTALQGLLHPALNENFFPDDLPEEWKLLYFANEFSACLLSLAELAIFAEESHEGLPADFKIYLSIDELNAIEDIPKEFTSYLAGLVVNPRSQDFEELFSDCIFQWPVCFQEKNAQDTFNGSKNLPLCHKNESLARLHCMSVSAEDISNLRSLRDRISGWQSNPVDNRVIFVKAGTDIELFRRLNELVRLLS